MTGQRSQLINFVSKFMGTVRFRNDHVATIMGYGDYQIGNVTVSRVYYVEGLGHNLFSVGQFCDADLEVAFRKHTCFVRDLKGVYLLKGSRGTNLYTMSLEEMMQSSPICLLSKASKTNEDLGKLKPKADIGIFIGYSTTKKAYQIYNKRTCLIMETIHVEFDKLTDMASEQFGSGPKLQLITPRTISLGLVQNPSPSTPYVPPTKKDWDILFQPMFDEYFQPLIDQDAPSASTSLTLEDLQEPILHQDVEGHEPPNAQFNNPFANIFNQDPSSELRSDEFGGGIEKKASWRFAKGFLQQSLEDRRQRYPTVQIHELISRVLTLNCLSPALFVRTLGMPIEFVVWVDGDTFRVSQALPKVYNEEAFIDNHDIYIISSEGYRYRAELVTPDKGMWYLTGDKWTEFCNKSLNGKVFLLHFMEEGDDCFYVTGYDRVGNEVRGYGVNRSTFSRFMTCVLPYPHIPQTLPAEFVLNLNDDDEIEISVNGMMLRCNVRRQEVIDHLGRHEFVLLGDTWDTLVKSLDLENGSVCVFTKNRGKRLWFDAFDDDGSTITNVVFKGAATLKRHHLQLTLLEE
ncbi:hypothetical protein Tco_1091973 [Tanacetum coccineum]|uniref:Integrase, catalytic region, zinc finger, CCHC-type, peptidase aspartic, catalytic n=1 Tax=Tanacetum coccineum TaxID=301880 RepID=A0ABQ5I8J9_9ASTR